MSGFGLKRHPHAHASDFVSGLACALRVRNYGEHEGMKRDRVIVFGEGHLFLLVETPRPKYHVG